MAVSPGELCSSGVLDLESKLQFIQVFHSLYLLLTENFFSRYSVLCSELSHIDLLFSLFCNDMFSVRGNSGELNCPHFKIILLNSYHQTRSWKKAEQQS